MDEYLKEYMESVREYYKEKNAYGKNLKADQIIRQILGRSGLQSSASIREIPIQADLELKTLMEKRRQMNDSWLISVKGPITSHRKGIGKLIVFGKKVVRKLLKWYVNPIAEKQTDFNSYATVATNEITNKMMMMERNYRVIDQKFRDIEEKLKMLDRIRDLEEDVEQNKSDVSYMAYRVRQAQGSGNIKNTLEEPVLHNPLQYKVMESNLPDIGLDYFLFENRFRGSEEQVGARLSQYVGFFKGRQNVLDIGCGRGEFLKLMADNGISARGIDINEDFVHYCSEKGLDVTLGDAISYLEQLPNNSLGGVFLGQVVEHLEPRYLTEMIELAWKKLEPGAHLVAETPNPTMLSTFSNSFYLDISHTQPIHPETLKFLLEYYGFQDSKILFSEASKIPYSVDLLQAADNAIPNLKTFNEGIDLLNQLLFGYQDYAAVGRKPIDSGEGK